MRRMAPCQRQRGLLLAVVGANGLACGGLDGRSGTVTGHGTFDPHQGGEPPVTVTGGIGCTEDADSVRISVDDPSWRWEDVEVSTAGVVRVRAVKAEPPAGGIDGFVTIGTTPCGSAVRDASGAWTVRFDCDGDAVGATWVGNHMLVPGDPLPRVTAKGDFRAFECAPE